MNLTPTLSVSAAVVTAVACGCSQAQTLVNVNEDQVMTETDLQEGEFLGLTFELSPNTIFNINSGGVMGPGIGEFNLTSEPSVPFDFAGSTINVNDGGILDSSTYYKDKNYVTNVTVNCFNGGQVGAGMILASGSQMHVHGGEVHSSLKLHQNASLHLYSGHVHSWYQSTSQNVNTYIYGGSFGRMYHYAGKLILHGNDFALDGQPVTVPPAVAGSEVLSATLSDGTPIILRNGSGFPPEITSQMTFVLSDVPEIEDQTLVIRSGRFSPNGLRHGQRLTVSGSGHLGKDFQCVQAELVIHGGSVGNTLEATRSRILVSGGEIGSVFEIMQNSKLRVTGGRFGENFGAYSGSTVYLSGGELGEVVDLYSESVLYMDGGQAGPALRLFPSTQANISGGIVHGPIEADRAASVKLYVREASLDGESLNLIPGQPMLIEARQGKILEATLAEGSPLNITLNGEPPHDDNDYIDAEATLSVTRACNRADWTWPIGVVDFFDAAHFLNTADRDHPSADLDNVGDSEGVLDLNDWLFFASQMQLDCD